MAQIVAIVSAEQDAIRAEQTGGSNLAIFRPSRRAVGGDIAGFACPDDRHEDGGGDGKNTAGRGNGRAFHENRGCISVEGEPPPEEGGRIVERPRSEEHTSELQSLMRTSYAVICLKNKKKRIDTR